MVMDWDDLRIFLMLVREGNLSAAARRLDVSHPTVARRIKGLEEALGARLFDRLPDRFALTAAGEELLADVEAMEAAANSIHRRSAGLSDTTRGTVRLSAGEAMTAFIARHLPTLRHGLQCVEIELSESHLLANLSRREADLLIREEIPDLASLISRRLGQVAYAVYSSRSLAPQGWNGRPLYREQLRALSWCGFDDYHGYMPGQAWMRDLLNENRPMVRVNNWLVLHELVRAGVGVTVLPCCLGDADPLLIRLTAVLPEVSADQFLLVHRDLRALPRIRAIMDALVRLFQDQRFALEGQTPSGQAVERLSDRATCN
jgi:DNA-binding transcriptional LysR family regulator